MSRSGYSNDCEGWDLIRWRGAVNSAIKGARGRAFLRELAAALDAMPEKRLANSVFTADGDACALGCVGRARGIDMTALNELAYAKDSVAPEAAKVFGIAHALAAEIMFMNDDDWMGRETPEHRWQRMRRWVSENLRGEDNP